MADQAKILVVDDEPSIRELLSASLSFAGFDVRIAADGHEAISQVSFTHPDLVILDIMLPDMDGYEVLTKLREHEPDLPVLFLTAKDDIRDKIKGLRVGGDDYVTKPFSLEEVVARIHAILRRTKAMDEDDSLVYADLVLNENSYEVHRAGVEVDLSPTEFKLLRYLMINAERVVSKEQIIDHVWDYNWHGEISIVESYISYLRRKIDSSEALGVPVTPLIHTKRAIGYVLRESK